MRLLFTSVLLTCLTFAAFSQEDTLHITDSTIYRVLKYDGTEFIGMIVSSNPHELLLVTHDRGAIYVPQHVIKSISAVNPLEYNQAGEYIGEDKFASRYFITTNGLPIKKGEHYIQWNWFGPDFQFGIGKNLGIGFMTTWLAMPVIADIKYSIKLGEKSNLAIGSLFGTTSWLSFAEEDLNIGGVLPFTTLSFGDRRANISFSGGYGGVWDNSDFQGRGLFSVAGMAKIGRKFSLVFDSFMILPGKTTLEERQEYYYNYTTGMTEIQTVYVEKKNPGIYLFIPGIRWHQEQGKAFQFGFTGLIFDDEIIPFPVPMVQWFRTL